MGEIRDTLVLEIDQALRQISQIGTSLDRALAPIEIEVDTRNVADLEDSLRRVERFASDITVETQALAFEAGRAEANFEDLARALDVSEDEARRLTGEILETRSAAIRLEGAARDVARQLGLSENEASNLTRELRRADTAAESIDIRTGGLVTSFGSLRSAAAGVAGAFAAIGGAQLLGAAVRGANAAIQSFAVLEDSINAVNVVFGDASASVLNFGETAARSAGLSQAAFNQAVVPIGSLLRNFGFDAQQAAEAAVVLVQRGADLASVFGGSVQDALLAVGAALRGEADPLERYGASISAARVEQFALAQGLVATKAAITPAITLQARYGLILQDTARVSGDFANTSGDLANAQRSAAAEAANFGTEIGEVLAPALEDLLVLLPDILEGVRQLVPGFASAADSAASFFESAGEGGGFRTEFAVIGAGLEVVTSGAGFAAEAARTLFAVLTNDVGGAVDSVQRGGVLIERAFTRGIGVALANALDRGADGVTAFGDAIEQTARLSSNIGIFTSSFRDFAIAAGLSQGELARVTASLIENRDAIGLTAEEVTFLNSQLIFLNDALRVSTAEGRALNRASRDLADTVTGTVNPIIVAANALADFGFNAATAAPLITDAFFAIREAGNTLVDALDPFKGAIEQLPVSAAEFVQNLRTQVEQIASFDVGLIRLRLAGFDDLADQIDEQGPAAQQALTGFLRNLNRAAEAEALLEGEGTKATKRLQDELTSALSDPNISAETRAALVQLIRDGGIDSPEVLQAIEDGAVNAARHAAAILARTYGESTVRELEAISGDIGDAIADTVKADDILTAGLLDELTAAGQEARAAFFSGINTSTTGETGELRQSILQTVNGAIQRQSPPQLFLDAGIDSGEAFWMGFEQADMSLRLPTPTVTGTVATAGVGQIGGGGDFVFSPTYVNTETRDLETVVARSEQTMAAVSGLLGKVKLV